MNKRFWAMLMAMIMAFSLASPVTVMAAEDAELAITDASLDASEVIDEENSDSDVSLPKDPATENNTDVQQGEETSSDKSNNETIDNDEPVVSDNESDTEKAPSEDEAVKTEDENSIDIPGSDTSSEETLPTDENVSNPENTVPSFW